MEPSQCVRGFLVPPHPGETPKRLDAAPRARPLAESPVYLRPMPNVGPFRIPPASPRTQQANDAQAECLDASPDQFVADHLTPPPQGGRPPEAKSDPEGPRPARGEAFEWTDESPKRVRAVHHGFTIDLLG